jgi:hypothetical protein
MREIFSHERVLLQEIMSWWKHRTNVVIPSSEACLSADRDLLFLTDWH